MDLTDEQWEVLAPLIPDPPRRADGWGRPWREPRAVLNGILWVLRTGAPWHDLPEHYPPYQTCHRRFQRWVEEGVLEEVLRALAEDLKERGGLDLSECFIDGTFVGAKKGEGRRERPSGEGYEAQGVGRPLWSSSRRTRGKRFSARGHTRRGNARGGLPRRGAPASDRGPGLRLGLARRGPRREGRRDDSAAPEEQDEAEDPGRAPAQALQEALEDRAVVRLDRELPAAGGALRAAGGELPRLRAPRVHRYPTEVFVR